MAISNGAGGVMRRIEASDSNVLSLIARLSTTNGLNARARSLIAELSDQSLCSVAEAIINEAPDPIGDGYRRWAKDIRRGSNGSLAKRRETLAS